MGIPSKYPLWATDDIVDPISGQNNVADPDLSDPNKKLEGWAFKEFPPRQWFNFLHRFVADWIVYFNEDLFGNTAGNDNRVLSITEINSADSISTDIDIISTNDIFIDSGNYLYLEGAYEVDIIGGDYVLIEAGTLIDLNAPEITSNGVIHPSGASAGFRVNSGKVLTEYREGSFTAPAVTGSGGFTPSGTWTWRWKRQDNIIDLILEGISGNVLSVTPVWTFVGVPQDILDDPSSNIQTYERSAARAISYVPLMAGVNSLMVDLTMQTGAAIDTVYLTFDQNLPTGTQNFGKMHFRYEVRD